MEHLKHDRQYTDFDFQLAEIEHHYGENVHLLANTYVLSQLARLCSPETTQPAINQLLTEIYSSLLRDVINAEFPVSQASIKTRLHADHPEGIYSGPRINPRTKTISVNLARAGTLPSHVCYDSLNHLLDPSVVRQDHVSIARTTNDQDKVTGSIVSGHKIGGPIEDSIVLFPDPMGATGGTIIEILNVYKSLGSAKKWIAIHCIVTPEYIRAVQQAHPDLVIYSARLDRGLSSDAALSSPPGQLWDQEKGLNARDYIVPGGGGFGEILNNAYV